jgi:PAS domain S-box-containing protein
METGIRSGTGAAADAGANGQKNRVLRVLLAEHMPADAERILRELHAAGIELTARRVASEATLMTQLEMFSPDIVLSDFGLGGMQALAVVRRHHPEIPFVFVSGTIGEESAAAAIRGGARDYVFKENLLRLPHAVRRALQEAAERSAREAAEQALRRSEGKNRLLARLVEQSSDAIFSTDLNGIVTSWNAGAARLYGYRAEEAIGRSVCLLELASAGDAELETVLARIRDPQPRAVETQNRTKAGELRDVSISTTPLFDPHGAHVGEMTVARDVTERRLQETKIARLSRIYALRSGINAAIVRVRDRQALFETACRLALEQANFAFAWIGVLEPATQALRATASAGTEAAVSADAMKIARRAVETRKPAFDNEIAGPVCQSVVSLPLLARGAVAAILMLYAVEQGYFCEEELKLLTELAADLSFALEHMQIEALLAR